MAELKDTLVNGRLIVTGDIKANNRKVVTSPNGSAAGNAATPIYIDANGYTQQCDPTRLRTQARFKTKVSGHGVAKQSLFAREAGSDTYCSFTTDSGTGTKTFDITTAFDIRKIYYYHNSADKGVNQTLEDNVFLEYPTVDMRYSFNGVTTGSDSVFVANKAVFLVFEKTLTNGGHKLKSPYYTQTPSDSSAIYVKVGTTINTYQLGHTVENLAFTYNSGADTVIPFTESDLTIYGRTLWSEGYRTNDNTNQPAYSVRTTGPSDWKYAITKITIGGPCTQMVVACAAAGGGSSYNTYDSNAGQNWNMTDITFEYVNYYTDAAIDPSEYEISGVGLVPMPIYQQCGFAMKAIVIKSNNPALVIKASVGVAGYYEEQVQLHIMSCAIKDSSGNYLI